MVTVAEGNSEQLTIKYRHTMRKESLENLTLTGNTKDKRSKDVTANNLFNEFA